MRAFPEEAVAPNSIYSLWKSKVYNVINLLGGCKFFHNRTVLERVGTENDLLDSTALPCQVATCFNHRCKFCSLWEQGSRGTSRQRSSTLLYQVLYQVPGSDPTWSELSAPRTNKIRLSFPVTLTNRSEPADFNIVVGLIPGIQSRGTKWGCRKNSIGIAFRGVLHGFHLRALSGIERFCLFAVSAPQLWK